MKKVLFIFLFGLCLFSITACNNDKNNTSDEPNEKKEIEYNKISCTINDNTDFKKLYAYAFEDKKLSKVFFVYTFDDNTKAEEYFNDNKINDNGVVVNLRESEIEYTFDLNEVSDDIKNKYGLNVGNENNPDGLFDSLNNKDNYECIK